MRRTARVLLTAALVAASPFLTGCGLAGGGSSREASTPAQASPGERQGTVPSSSPRSSEPAGPSATPQQALERFADGYVNWTYRTLVGEQHRLAASAVGAARESELEAAQRTSRDRPLVRGRIFNIGEVVSIAPLRGGRPTEWVVVTRERTGGDGEYSSLQPAYHVTLASVQRVSGGFAVNSWRPGL